jgi:hypothetical protein
MASARGEIKVRMLSAGVLAIVVAFLFGLETADGGPDVVGIVTGLAGVVIVFASLIPWLGGLGSHR